METTKITSVFDSDSQVPITNQIYPVYSHDNNPILQPQDVRMLTDIFVSLKLNKYYDCIKKAQVVAAYLNVHYITLGSLMVESTERNVAYGYHYNPPLELHAWVTINNKIIDFALAGTIEKGLSTRDDVGYFLKDRKPIILAGTPPPWAKYKSQQEILSSVVSVMSLDRAKEEFLKNFK